MKNDTCVVCGEKFTPRESKLYCSDSCKQTAFERRKNDKQNKTAEIQTNSTSVNKIIIFDYSEYKEVISKLPKCYIEWMPFETYCFIRKTLSGTPSVEKIIEMLKVYEELINSTDLHDESVRSPFYNQYQQFLKEMFDEKKYMIKNE